MCQAGVTPIELKHGRRVFIESSGAVEMERSKLALQWGSLFVLILLLCALVIWPPASQAQINTGKIVGFITDTSGGVVPEARVRATDIATGVVSVSSTSQSGSYLVNFLVPGTYQVEVLKQGFVTEAQRGVVVTAGQSIRLDIQLRVGAVHQVVEVKANPTAVNTQNSEEKFTFSNASLETLPNIDRNPLLQLNLMPGAQSGSGSGNYGTNGGEDGSAVGLTNPQLAGFGGMDANANTVYIEGIPTREPQNAYIGLVPPEDDVEELDVYTGKYDAEYGFSASGVINVVTKSGTNQFHGDVFEYLENDALDAIPFFATSTTPFKRNQFGGSVGGPIKKDKVFFFADFQRTPDLQASPVIASAPTPQMYAGDFSQLYVPGQTDTAGNTYGQLYNPFTRVFNSQGNQVSVQSFAGNAIPSQMWDPVAAKMAAAHIFGLPNLPGIQNNLYYLNEINQYTNQGDGRLDYSISDASKVFFRYSGLDATLANPPTVNPFIENSANSATLNQNMGLTFDHTFNPSLMNELRLGYNRTDVNTSNNTLGKPYNNLFGIPNGNPPGAGGTGTGLAEFLGVDPYSALSQPDWVAFIVSNTISLSDNLTWIKGKHTLKFGTMINHVEDTSADTIGGDNPRGGFYFNPQMTSYNGSAADFGFPSFLLGTPVQTERTQFDYGFPYQTYWEQGYYAQDDYQVSPTLSLNLGMRWEYWTLPVERFNRQSNWNTQTNQLAVATAANRSPGVTPDYHDFEPRLGFAWSPDHGKTAIRGGWGISYWQNYWGFSPSSSAQSMLTVLGATYPFYVRQEFLTPNALTPSLTISANGLPPAVAEKNSQGGFILPPGQTVRGVAYDWKNQKVSQYSFDVQRQLMSGLVMDVGYLGVYGGNNPTTININQAPPSPIIGINYNLNRPLAAKYPGLLDVPVSESIGSSSYNALTASLRGNVTKDLQIFTTFAYSRTFANGFNINPFAIGQYYGPANNDLPLIFNSQVIYTLPIGHGERFLSDDNPVLDKFIGGWRSSAFITIQSGYPFTVASPVSLLNNGQSNRPNLTAGCNPNLSNPTLQQWFNTACFVNDLAPGTYGTEGTNVLRADGLQQVNFSMFKNFKVGERYNLQFEGDFQNLFNHPNYGFPDLTVGDPAMGAVTTATVNARIIQLGLKFSF